MEKAKPAAAATGFGVWRDEEWKARTPLKKEHQDWRK